MQPSVRQRLLGYPLLVVFSILVIVLIATIMPVATASAATASVAAVSTAHERTACDGATLVRRLMLVDEGHNDSATLDAAMTEAEVIWATAGVRLAWMPIGLGSRPDAYVVLRGGRPNAMKEAAMMKAGGSRELGWVRFDGSGARPNLVEVSLPAVRSTLMHVWHGDRLLRLHPRVILSHVLGRALGRIIAHEIGHWLIGFGHTKEGLMQPILRPSDLLRADSPRLPSSWTDGSDSRVALLRTRCEESTNELD
jgi:hypothetical protein